MLNYVKLVACIAKSPVTYILMDSHILWISRWVSSDDNCQVLPGFDSYCEWKNLMFFLKYNFIHIINRFLHDTN